jgi:hypothetical protein
LDVTQISIATDLAPRRVRYVLDHRVLPGLEHTSKGHRVTRAFTPFEAFGIALAALLLEAGLRRAVVADALRALVAATPARAFPGGRSPLLYAFTGGGNSRLEVGDGANVRLTTRSPGAPHDTGWVRIATGHRVGEAYAPLVALAVDTGRLANRIRAFGARDAAAAD